MKIFRNIFCLLLAIVLLASAMPAASAAADSSAVCMEYYDIIRESIRLNGGVCEPSTVQVWGVAPSPDEPGIYFAQLIDMDRDSVPELVLMESVAREQTESEAFFGTYSYDLYLRIYTARNNKATMILNEKQGFMFRWGFYKAEDGNTYFGITPSGGYSYYYGAKNGQLVSKAFNEYIGGGGFGCYINGEYVWVDVPGYNTSASYYINDQKVTVAEYIRQENAMKKTALAIYGAKSNYPADDTAYNAIAELEKLVPASFLAGYSTPSSWAQSAVDRMKELNILPDHLQRMYNQPITRLHFCELAMEFYEYATAAEITERMDFTDTANEAVRKMGGLGVINGTGGGAFSPDAYLTREQAAVILARMADKLGWTLPTAESTFADNASISSWALEQVGRIQAAGIMNGTGGNNFSPKAQYTLEQSILTMLRMQNVQAPVSTVELSETSLEMLPGGHYILTATAYTNGAPVAQTFTWSSSNPAVVSVNADTGIVTAHKSGTAVITATGGSGGKGECRITVPTVQGNIYVDHSGLIYGESRSMPRSSSNKDSEVCAFQLNTVTFQQNASFPFDYIKLGVVIRQLPAKQYIYLDWNLYDADGELVCSGPTDTSQTYFYYDVGDSYTFSLRTAKLDPNQYYRLEIVDYQP